MIRADMTYGALCAKTRALYGKRLRLADYQHMAGLESVEDVMEYLRLKPGWSAAVGHLLEQYGGGFIGRVELEAVLWDQVYTEYAGLSHYVPRSDRAIMQFPVLLAEVRAILATLRRLKAGHVKDTPVSFRLLAGSRLDPKVLWTLSDYAALTEAAKETIYHAALRRMRPAEGEALPDYAAAEALLRSTYFSHMYRVIHKQYAGETQKVLLRAYGEQIDLLNIIHILRLKTYFPGVDSYFAVLFPFNYRLRPEFIRALCAAPDAAGVFELLKGSPYASSFTDVDVGEVEDYYRRAFYSFNKRQLISGRPSIYTAMAYLNLKELELRALVTVIESVKYGAPYDDSFARLIGD